MELEESMIWFLFEPRSLGPACPVWGPGTDASPQLPCRPLALDLWPSTDRSVGEAQQLLVSCGHRGSGSRCGAHPWAVGGASQGRVHLIEEGRQLGLSGSLRPETSAC